MIDPTEDYAARVGALISEASAMVQEVETDLRRLSAELKALYEDIEGYIEIEEEDKQERVQEISIFPIQLGEITNGKI
jgi:hypothetical protein|tara:strand:- start:312 stop:545 length:234 start_codon:yes stop_codon:yes gene_type:complete